MYITARTKTKNDSCEEALSPALAGRHNVNDDNGRGGRGVGGRGRDKIVVFLR